METSNIHNRIVWRSIFLSIFQKVDVQRFSIIPTDDAFVMLAGFEERGTALARWLEGCKHWDGRRDLTVERHAPFVDKHFLFLYEEIEYEGQLSLLMTQLCVDKFVLEIVILYLCCGESDS